MLPRRQQTRKTPEGARRPNRMPYRDQHRSQAGKQGDQRERTGKKDRESWFCFSCANHIELGGTCQGFLPKLGQFGDCHMVSGVAHLIIWVCISE